MKTLYRLFTAAVLAAFFMGAAHAQWQVPNHSTPVGRGSGTGFKSVGPCATGVPVVSGGASSDPTCGVSQSTIPATCTGSPNSLTVVPSFLPTGVTTPQDGMRFRCDKMPFTATARPIGLVITGLTGSWNLTQPDAYTALGNEDLAFGQALTIEWVSATSKWVVLTPPGGFNSFVSHAFTHGAYKLQASDAVTLQLGSNDGGAVLGWNSTAGAYRMVLLGPGGSCSLVLNNLSATINGVANQSVALNTQYITFLSPQTGSTDPSNPAKCMELWTATATTYQIEDSNDWGIYVLNNNGTIDKTRIYLGAFNSGNDGSGHPDISNAINPAAAIGSKVFSHSTLSRWVLGYKNTAVSNTTTAGSAAAAFATPSYSFETEGIDSSPPIFANGSISCVGAASGTIEIYVSGSTTIGGAWSDESTPTPIPFTVAAGETKPITGLAWVSAPPAGYYEAQIKASSAGNNCTWVFALAAQGYQ